MTNEQLKHLEDNLWESANALRAYGGIKADFKHKLSIAPKEINETIYWLELLEATDAVEIIKLRSAILKTTKANMNN